MTLGGHAISMLTAHSGSQILARAGSPSDSSALLSMVPASVGPHGQRCWCFSCSRDPSCRNPRAAPQRKGPSRAQRASPFYLVRPVRLRAGCWRRVSLQVGARVGSLCPRPPARLPAHAYRADETIPVLPPHVRTGSEVDAELLVGAQHAPGEVGEEGCSFPVGEHTFHKLCSETQEWGCSPPGEERGPNPQVSAKHRTRQATLQSLPGPPKETLLLQAWGPGSSSLTRHEAKWEPSLLSHQPPPIPNQSQTLCTGPLP